MAQPVSSFMFWRTTTVEIGPDTEIPKVFAAVSARLGGAFVMPMVLANGQAALESPADQVGLEYMAGAGYDPEALADFFERILSSMPKRASAFSPWANFPASTERRPTHYATTGAAEFHDIQDRVASLIARLTPPGAVPTLNPVQHLP
jgi:hypothetical protein